MLVLLVMVAIAMPLLASCGQKKTSGTTEAVAPTMMKQNMQKGGELMQQGQKAAK